ncbi:MAG: 3-ketoacyl-(acyl-carrier-protein) reductase [Moraxellaceae bacterium]|jgi:NAD(P)-dependent dehydrogenase (short-subunit alcohol dehydrogenase family)/pimeloyl-ACP methyl ester carboxylesterase|nr:3-ketoacyl-(acyl-carrier-protein) reductase [Moraxellaceae bacterium]
MKTMTARIQSAGVSLHVTGWGDSRKTPVVLVHGYPDNHLVWKPVAEHLAKHFYVIAYDVRGAGQSDAPPGVRAYTLELLAQDLAAVVDTVIPNRRFHLVGHDWGSIQSWESVTTERLKPRIASYTTISGPALDHAAHWVRERTLNLSPAAKAKVMKQLLSSWYIGFFQLPVLPTAGWRAGFGKLWPTYLEKREGVVEAEPNPTQITDGANGVQLYRANFRQKLIAPEIRHAACPVQLIVPTRDNYVSPQLFEDLHRWVPELYRRDINASHWVPLSHPNLIAAWIVEFVEGVERGELSIALQRARVRPTRQALPLAGKLAVVTGAGSGIGRATALKFAEEGADLVCVDINTAAAERTAALCRLLDATAWARTVDVGAAKAMEALAKEVEKDFGGADIMVNNAGIGMAGGLLDTSVADWDKLLKVNLWGVIHGSRLFAQQMVAGGRAGHIVNVASAAAFAPNRKLAAYSTSKAAVHMLTECLRAELAGHAIGVTAICPGFVATGIASATVYAGVSEAEQVRLRSKADALYKRRNFAPEDVATAVFRAVQDNPALSLVGAEAWATRLLSRFVPGVSRLVARIDLTP